MINLFIAELEHRMRVNVARYLNKGSKSGCFGELLDRADRILKNRGARLPILGYTFDGNNYIVIRDQSVRNDHGLRELARKHGIFIWGE